MGLFTQTRTPGEQFAQRQRDEREIASETRHALAQQKRADQTAEDRQRQDTRSERERREAQERRAEAQRQEEAMFARQREVQVEREGLRTALANAQAALASVGGVDLSTEASAIDSIDNAARRIAGEFLVDRAERALQRFEDGRLRR
jgi:hypothetical protein